MMTHDSTIQSEQNLSSLGVALDMLEDALSELDAAIQRFEQDAPVLAQKNVKTVGAVDYLDTVRDLRLSGYGATFVPRMVSLAPFLDLSRGQREVWSESTLDRLATLAEALSGPFDLEL